MYQTLNSSGVKMGRVKVDGNIEKKNSFLKNKKKTKKNKQTKHWLFLIFSGQTGHKCVPFLTHLTEDV